ncbi:chemotaxis response regulator protein-glutamate methylesterase [Sanguibacter sp. HDW7]|uniref:protein-glutamate methylesterase/protein-glutamine glutaminase n=1 Tax=Sanguibacter sp. HDW7 TaxID=2714931 RepID=UPI001F0D6D28|nr:chemotaxis response regulator protein-glutamate methylesterase [Sanguibacter sp. HDW7]
MPIRVLVVDDSVVIRRLLVQALESETDVEVVGTASDGARALLKAEQLRPDAITMDIEMPEMDGVTAVRELRRRGVRVPIVMFSTLTARGASSTLDALAAGASDYVTKPSNVGSLAEALSRVAGELVPKLRALVGRGTRPTALAPAGARPALGAAPARATVPAPAPAPALGGLRGVSVRRTPAVLPPAPTHPVRAVVVGSSTGGPEALSRVVGGLRRPLPVPMIVTQHMPPLFTAQLALRLDRLGPSTVVEASDGDVLRPGHVYVAPGDFHLELAGTATAARIVLTQSPPVNFCRPSVDVMVRSALSVLGPHLLGVVLTGMGQDGAAAAAELVEAGGTMISQDEATSVVWGMPGAVAAAGSTHRILPLDVVADAIMSRCADSGAFTVGGAS